MTHPIGLTPGRRGERGALPLMLALFAGGIVIFVLAVLLLIQAQRAGSGGAGGDETATEGGGAGEVTPGDGGDPGPLQLAAGCIIFSRHPRVTPRFVEKVVQIARQLSTDPNFMMATMKIESDFDHTVRNRMGGSATGLIQIVDSTARSLGLPNAAVLASMSAEQQLDYVRRYYVMSGGGGGRMRDPEDAYMVVFYPKAAGQSSSYVIARRRVACTPEARRHDAYCGNEPYDLDHDGVILKSEAGRKARRVYDAEVRKCAKG
jgi:hypothetical protein